MQTLPTRISGATILRQLPSRRADGSEVLVRRSARESLGVSSHEEIFTAQFAFTSEPSYTRAKVSRSLRCLEGECYAVIVDLRHDSTTFGDWQGIFLSEGDARTLLIPTGVACGWQILSSTATLELRISREIHAQRWQWLRWNDCDLGVQWPEWPSNLAHHVCPSRSLRSIAERRLPGPQTGCDQPETARPGLAETPARRRRSINSVAKRDLSTQRSAATLIQPASSRSRKAERKLILVIGSSGQLGSDLCRHLRTLGTVVGACRRPDRTSILPVPVFVDISRPASLRQAIRQVQPTLIVNAAALTDIDQAESEPRLAQLVNATAPAIIADEAKRIQAAIIHFCSDMVFAGSGESPWRETDLPDPQNQYARTKLLGSEAISNSDVPHMILRAGWLYSTHGDNFVRRLMDSLAYRNSVTLASDHCGSPTSTDWLSRVTAQVLSQAPGSLQDWLKANGGLYHAATLGYASKLEVADQIVATCRQHGLPIVLKTLQSRPLAQLPSLAPIPANCRLDPARFAMKFQLELPRWQDELSRQIAVMLGAQCQSLRSVA